MQSLKPTPEPSGETYNVGDTVKHRKFGIGTVVAAQKTGKDTLLRVNFEVGEKAACSLRPIERSDFARHKGEITVKEIYSDFAQVDDRLQDIDDNTFVEDYKRLFAAFGCKPELVLDLGCGKRATSPFRLPNAALI